MPTIRPEVLEFLRAAETMITRASGVRARLSEQEAPEVASCLNKLENFSMPGGEGDHRGGVAGNVALGSRVTVSVPIGLGKSSGSTCDRCARKCALPTIPPSLLTQLNAT